MNYLSVENLAKNYGERILFEGLTFGLSQGEKMALIANNGTGKSSLLKIIAGTDIADDGSVTIRSGIKIGYLAQEPDFNQSLSIEELINTAHTDVMKLIHEYEDALAEQSENFNEQTQKRLEGLSAQMDEANAWDYDRQMKEILSKFNIQDLSQKVGDLSGGQQKRLSFAMLLLDNPELLLLDEPTNHLDMDMIEWLEKYLQQQKITLLMVTHDRYFLDRVCNHILELEGGKLYHHRGNYAYFLEKRAEREAAFDVEVSKAGKLLKKELEWMRKSPKARTTKSKSRISNFYKIKEKAHSKKGKRRTSAGSKMSRIGGKILELKKVYKSYGDLEILKDLTTPLKKVNVSELLEKTVLGKVHF